MNGTAVGDTSPKVLKGANILAVGLRGLVSLPVLSFWRLATTPSPEVLRLSLDIVQQLTVNFPLSASCLFLRLAEI